MLHSFGYQPVRNVGCFESRLQSYDNKVNSANTIYYAVGAMIIRDIPNQEKVL